MTFTRPVAAWCHARHVHHLQNRVNNRIKLRITRSVTQVTYLAFRFLALVLVSLLLLLLLLLLWRRRWLLLCLLLMLMTLLLLLLLLLLRWYWFCKTFDAFCCYQLSHVANMHVLLARALLKLFSCRNASTRKSYTFTAEYGLKKRREKNWVRKPQGLLNHARCRMSQFHLYCPNT